MHQPEIPQMPPATNWQNEKKSMEKQELSRCFGCTWLNEWIERLTAWFIKSLSLKGIGIAAAGKTKPRDYSVIFLILRI